jgi:integrase
MKENETAKENQGESLKIQRNGVVARIRPTVKGDKTYYVVDYRLNGKQKLVWRSTFVEAKAVANDACDKISNGQAATLDLSIADRNFYMRAVEALKETGKAVDTAAAEYAAAVKLLAGKTTLIEACREWINRNADILETINVAAGAEKLKAQLIADGKSEWRIKGVAAGLTSLAEHFNGQPVDRITPDQISSYLAGLALGNRTKKNHRDVIGFFNRWLCLHKYLPKDVDWLHGVQNYSKAKHSEITIYTPEEMEAILKGCTKDELAAIAISAFSAMRHAEVCRLTWENIQLSDKRGESWIEVKGGKNERHGQLRRLVPVSDNLRSWLMTCRKETGPVTALDYEQSTKHLPHVVSRAKVAFKRNAFRHSGISYRIAQTGDVPRIAEESGNSVAVIRMNYLRVVKPEEAKKWFAIMPPKTKKQK